jgi:hypothetical protein
MNLPVSHCQIGGCCHGWSRGVGIPADGPRVGGDPPPAVWEVDVQSASGEQLHESTVLSYSEAGRTRFVMLSPVDVAAVRAAVERYRAAQASLEAAGEAGRAQLINALSTRRRTR